MTRRAPSSPELSKQEIRKLADRMLAELDLEEAELSVLLTDDSTIHRLNHEHLGKDRPTDVLAFPLDEGEPTGLPGERLLGDIVISLDTAARQAASRRRDLLSEVRFLLAHGLLHLIGYDHATPDEKKEMTRETRRLVAACEGSRATPRVPRRR